MHAHATLLSTEVCAVRRRSLNGRNIYCSRLVVDGSVMTGLKVGKIPSSMCVCCVIVLFPCGACSFWRGKAVFHVFMVDLKTDTKIRKPVNHWTRQGKKCLPERRPVRRLTAHAPSSISANFAAIRGEGRVQKTEIPAVRSIALMQRLLNMIFLATIMLMS